MEILKDVLKTGRNITGAQLFSAIDTTEELYQNKTTYVETIMPNTKDLTVALETSKELEALSSKCMLKNNSLVIIVSYCPKPNKNVLLVLTVHSEPDLCEDLHNKPVDIDFHNSQRCSVDIVSQMFHDYTCQPTCDR